MQIACDANFSLVLVINTTQNNKYFSKYNKEIQILQSIWLGA